MRARRSRYWLFRAPRSLAPCAAVAIASSTFLVAPPWAHAQDHAFGESPPAPQVPAAARGPAALPSPGAAGVPMTPHERVADAGAMSARGGPPLDPASAELRRGARVVFGGGPRFSLILAQIGGFYDPDPIAAAGFQLFAGVNVGLTRAVDLRFTTGIDGAFGGSLHVLGTQTAAVRLNLTSSYSMELGFRGGGGLFAVLDGESGGGGLGVLGPEISLASLRLGNRRQVELTLSQWFAFFVADRPLFTLVQGISFTYLVLPGRSSSAMAKPPGKLAF
jgi:hypothetical protein